MEDYKDAMLKSLVAVAWADGHMDGEESEVIEALISAFQLEDGDADAIRDYAKERHTVDEVPLSELSIHDRRLLIQHAVILAYVDGNKSDEEQAVLDALVQKLKLPEDEAKELMESAEKRAKGLLDLL